jgi:hypothetical protein
MSFAAPRTGHRLALPAIPPASDGRAVRADALIEQGVLVQ